ncbi:hypothetical protein RJ640_008469 [Escallonia rubra]|uniref:Survival protein SurE-like phosphatase/nucleotidase domain-containing protein n=1 Tax=Escallonia rubra TaxID=112253 RepID=A0AA88SK79_9ASTE|nr:hypothetical protein RJ640_008469 [Escallonia rubra]
MTTSAVKNNQLPPGLLSNLQNVLLSRKGGEDEQPKSSNESAGPSSSDSAEPSPDADGSKPVVLVTSGDGIDSPGLTHLVEALLNLWWTPVDCVSLALSGALFSWSKPLLVISGVNKGSSCGHHTFYSGVVAAAREALISGVPSMSISLNWKKDESQESDFKDALSVCLPLINAAIRDIEKGIFPKSCLLNIEVPTSPLANKGFKLTKRSSWRSTPSWQAISANRHPSAGRFMSNQQSLGMQLAQLGRDASAAGAARRLTTQRKSLVEVESVGVAGKSDNNRTVKYFRLEVRNLIFLDKELKDLDEDLDFRALENGFIAITPLSLFPDLELDTQKAVFDWISAAFQADQ